MVGILIANLITLWIDSYFFSYKSKFPAYLFTWIGMGVIVLIYYPLFTRIDKWSTKVGDKFIKAGKKVWGRKLGATIAFIIALLFLYYLYGKEWFNSNVLKDFFRTIYSS